MLAVCILNADIRIKDSKPWTESFLPNTAQVLEEVEH